MNEIQNQYTDGVITDGERYNKVVDIWAKVQDEIGGKMLKGLSTQVFGRNDKGEDVKGPSFNPIFMMADSGARGSAAADPPAGRHARPDGQAVRRDHRNSDHRQFPRRADGAAVLHLDSRRA